MSKGRCELCGCEIEGYADVCERHAMSHDQLAEMMRRIQIVRRTYVLELWPELGADSREPDGTG